MSKLLDTVGAIVVVSVEGNSVMGGCDVGAAVKDSVGLSVDSDVGEFVVKEPCTGSGLEVPGVADGFSIKESSTWVG